MHFEKIHNKGQAQLFKNQYVEMLTKTHPLVIWGMYLPAFAGLPLYAAYLGYTPVRIIMLFLVGMCFWTLFEYIMHRFAFHWVAESERARKIVYVMHGNHHHFPRDKERLFMPPVPSLIISSTIFALMYLVVLENAFVVFPG